MERTTSTITHSSLDSGYGSILPDMWTASTDDGFLDDDTVMSQAYYPQQSTEHALTSMGAAYTDDNVPTAYPAQLYSPSQLFDEAVGSTPGMTEQATDAASTRLFDEAIGSIPVMTQQASDAALTQLSEEQSLGTLGTYQLSMLNFEAMREAGAAIKQDPDYKSLDRAQIFRKTVQCELHSYLYRILRTDSFDISSMQQASRQATQEAAYQLQYQLWREGADTGPGICYFALADALDSLQKVLVSEESSAGTSSAPQATTHSPKPIKYVYHLHHSYLDPA